MSLLSRGEGYDGTPWRYHYLSASLNQRVIVTHRHPATAENQVQTGRKEPQNQTQNQKSNWLSSESIE